MELIGSWRDGNLAMRFTQIEHGHYILAYVAILPDSEGEIEATSEDAERHLQFEAGGGDGMNVFGQQAIDQAARGFLHFAGGRHQVGHRRAGRALGVLLVQRNQVQVHVHQRV